MKKNNYCQYSFKDLMKAANKSITQKDMQNLYSMSQKKRNQEVKEMCKIAKWFCKDVIGDDGIYYTAFAPTSNLF